MFSWWNHTVTRIRPGVKIERGAEVPDWSPGVIDILDIAHCHLQPATTSLSQDGRVLGISDGYTCYMPPDADVKAGDRIVYGGKTYIITGESRVWPSATGSLDHIMLNLMRWTG
jgi:hypothetical protein